MQIHFQRDGRQQLPQHIHAERLRLAGAQHQAVIVGSKGEAVWRALAPAIGEQRGQSLVHGATGEGIQEKVLSIARAQGFHQQLAGIGQGRQLPLQRNERLECGTFRIQGIGREQSFDLAAQLARQRHAAALPLGHDAVVARGQAHVRRHVMQLDQFQRLAGELEAAAGFQSADEALFHGTEPAALEELDGNAAVAGDRADRQPMAKGDFAIVHAVDAVGIAHDPAVFRIARQRRATLHDEIQHRLPTRVVERGKGIGAAHFGQQRISLEAAAERQRHAVLGQHVKRHPRRRARLDRATAHCFARCSVFE